MKRLSSTPRKRSSLAKRKHSQISITSISVPALFWTLPNKAATRGPSSVHLFLAAPTMVLRMAALHSIRQIALSYERVGHHGYRSRLLRNLYHSLGRLTSRQKALGSECGPAF